MVKLKDLLKEGSPGYKNRQFGDPLPTLKDIMKEKKMKDLELGKVYTDSDMPPFKVTEEVVDEATPSKSFFNGFKQLPLYKEMNPNQRQAVSIALIMGGDMTGAVKEIEKIKKGLSKDKKVKNALKMANESINENKCLCEACWKGYEKKGMKKMFGKTYPNCVKKESYDIWAEDGSFGYSMDGLLEAEYQGRKVKLGKPMQGDAKKFKVYVKNDKGNVVKVNFGQGGDAKGGTMRIRKSNPGARKSFRARHNCDTPGPRHKARYWSCKKW